MKYDFSDLEDDSKKDKLKEDIRDDFRIQRCCGTCNYFYSKKGNDNKVGFCKLVNLKNEHYGRNRAVDPKKEAEGEGWPPTHVFTVCDHHEIRNEYTIKVIERWVKRRFNFDGSLNEEISKEDFPNDT